MGDVALIWGIGRGDILIKDGDLAVDNGLTSAILISLFSDARDDSQSLSLNNRGFWAENENDKYGSLLWLFYREKIVPATVEKVKQYALQALAWLKEDGIASDIDVNVYRKTTSGLFMEISVFRGSSKKYDYIWKEARSFSQTVENLDLTVKFS